VDYLKSSEVHDKKIEITGRFQAFPAWRYDHTSIHTH